MPGKPRQKALFDIPVPQRMTGRVRASCEAVTEPLPRSPRDEFMWSTLALPRARSLSTEKLEAADALMQSIHDDLGIEWKRWPDMLALAYDYLTEHGHEKTPHVAGLDFLDWMWSRESDPVEPNG